MTALGDHWRTPPAVLELARTVLGGLDLDPAATRAPSAHFAKQNYSRGGLDRGWLGRVYLNPPYSQLKLWIPHASQQVGATVLALVPPSVGTSYWHRYVWPPNGQAPWKWEEKRADEPRTAAAVAFPQGRIAFLDRRGRPCGGNRYESAFVLWRSDEHDEEIVDRFCQVFARRGRVVRFA